jgi:hypothetical protein
LKGRFALNLETSDDPQKPWLNPPYPLASVADYLSLPIGRNKPSHSKAPYSGRPYSTKVLVFLALGGQGGKKAAFITKKEKPSSAVPKV